MRAIETSADDPASLLADTILQHPNELMPELTVIETELDLGEGLHVDLLGVGAEERPVLVLIEAGDENLALLRAVRLLQEVRDREPLLNRLFRAQGLSWSKAPQVVLLCPRVSDAMTRLLADLLGHLAITCREFVVVEIDGVRRAVLGRQIRSTPRAAASLAASVTVASVPATTRRSRLNGPAPARRELTRPEPAAAHPVEVIAPLPSSPPAPSTPAPAPQPPRVEDPARRLFLEAKKKILRIADKIEEEVDGDEVRFRVQQGVLAILSLAAGELRARSDDQQTPAVLTTDEQLDAFLNETFRRYLSLAGRGELTLPIGHPLDRQRASA